MSTPWRRHCSPKIAGASLWNRVPNSEVGRLFCFFFAARRPSQLLSTYYDCRQLVQLSAHLCLQHVGRAVERRAVPLRQSTLVIAAVSRVCHIARPAHAPFYSAPDREAEYCDERVCVCVCVCVCPRSCIRNYTSGLHQIFVRVTYAVARSFLWRRNDTLCTSGFMDDVIFAHKPKLLDVAAQLKRIAHAALGLANGYMLCAVIPVTSQRTHGTTFLALKVTSQVATLGAECLVYDCLVTTFNQS